MSKHTIASLAAAYRAGTANPVDVTEEYLARIEAYNEPVYRTVNASRARTQARAARELFAAGVDLGPLQGIPLAVKDNLDTIGDITAAGSRVLLEEGTPASTDSEAVAHVVRQGAVLLGKTNMTELAFSGIGMNPHFGTPGSAVDPSRIPGGSSAGSGVAVGADLAVAAFGTDTGGSVRIPAACNHVVGHKITDGSVSNRGGVALSPTLDTVGPIARTVRDAWTLYLAMAGRADEPLGVAHRPVSFLVPDNVVLDELDEDVRKAFVNGVEMLTELGHSVQYANVPVLDEIHPAMQTYGSFAAHEVFTLREREFAERSDDIDPRVAERAEAAAQRSARDYLKLVYAREAFQEEFWPTLDGVDAVLAPTLPIIPPTIDSLASDEAYHRANGLVLRNTTLFNVLASPATAVPLAIPLTSMMIVTRPHADKLALQIAQLFER